MAMPLRPSQSNGSSSERVRKSAPVGFEKLRGRAAIDHDVWVLRRTLKSDELAASVPRSVVRANAAILLKITSQLAQIYGTPDLGNKSDPVDELVYIILSRRTREGAYQRAFDILKSSFATWETLAEADLSEIAAAVTFCGLGRRKAVSLKSALSSLIESFGACTLEPTRDWSDEDVAAFLCALPEVGPKSAACVMMCSLDRPAFPVDAHVGRVLERLGVMNDAGVALTGRDHKFKQAALWDAIPPSLRYPLHVNLLVHGRKSCLPLRPKCGDCLLRESCEVGRNSRLARL